MEEVIAQALKQARRDALGEAIVFLDNWQYKNAANALVARFTNNGLDLEPLKEKE